MTPARSRSPRDRRSLALATALHAPLFSRRPRRFAVVVPLLLASLLGPVAASAQDVQVETVERTILGLTAFQLPEDAKRDSKIALHDQQVALRDILAVRYPRASARQPDFQLLLADGSRLTGFLTRSEDEDRLQLQTSLRSDPIAVPLTWVREIRHRAPENAGASDSPEELDTDRLSTREGATLDGIMLKVGANGITFEDSKLGELEFSWPQITRLRLAALEKAPAPDADALRVAVESADGSRLLGGVRSFTRTEIEIESPLLGELSIPVANLAEVEFLLGRVIHLSDREPERVEEGHPAITPETFERFFAWRRDARVGPEKGPLVIGDRTFRRGIGVHSRSQLVFAVEPGDRTFQAWIGLDRTARPEQEITDYGAVVFRVLVDGKDAFAPRPMNWQLPPQKIEVPLDGVKELTLLVEPGAGEHVLDRANWGDARILRE